MKKHEGHLIVQDQDKLLFLFVFCVIKTYSLLEFLKTKIIQATIFFESNFSLKDLIKV